MFTFCFFLPNRAIHDISAYWFPKDEKSKLSSFIGSMMEFGTLIATLISPYIVIYLGWEWVFYIFGAIGLIWSFLFSIFGASTPQSSKWISNYEKQLLEREIQLNVTEQEERQNLLSSNQSSLHQNETTNQNTPWYKLLTSGAVWAIVIGHFCFNFGWYVLLSWLPNFFLNLGVEFDHVGYYTMLPYAAMLIGSNVIGFVSDFMINKCKIGTTMTRKIMQCGSFIGSALFLYLLRHSKNVIIATLLLIVSVGFRAASRGG